MRLVELVSFTMIDHESIETGDLLVRTWKTLYTVTSMESSASNSQNTLRRFERSPLEEDSQEGAHLHNLRHRNLCWNIQ